MKTRRLGTNGPIVSALGFGLMSLSSTYGPSEDEESVRTMHRALDLGIGFFDTAELYGVGHNERLAARVLAQRRDEVVLATKFGIALEGGRMVANGRPENVRRAIDGSLGRLGVPYVDLYYLHRRDPDVSIEETVGAMAELVKAGKVRHLGLSAISADTLRRAAKVHPIAAVQSEYSLFTRDPERGLLDACAELGTGFVPYSPLGRGVLTGAIKSEGDLGANDLRRISPRLHGENLEHNLTLVERVKAMAADQGIEPSQLVLAWLLHQRPWIVPIFGTRRAARVEENAGAVDVALTKDDLARLEAAVPAGAVQGEGLPESFSHLQER
jgi:aryl-alcohol dehydrogenase-like predicted oxidoreductase